MCAGFDASKTELPQGIGWGRIPGLHRPGTRPEPWFSGRAECEETKTAIPRARILDKTGRRANERAGLSAALDGFTRVAAVATRARMRAQDSLRPFARATAVHGCTAVRSPAIRASARGPPFVLSPPPFLLRSWRAPGRSRGVPARAVRARRRGREAARLTERPLEGAPEESVSECGRPGKQRPEREGAEHLEARFLRASPRALLPLPPSGGEREPERGLRPGAGPGPAPRPVGTGPKAPPAAEPPPA